MQVVQHTRQTELPYCAGLARQMERKARLEKELRREKERLAEMNTEVTALKEDLNKRHARKAIASLRGSTQSAVRLRAEQLRVEIKCLQEECKRMAQEVDLHGGQAPLGETSEEFYQNIYTGQQGFVLPPSNFSQSFQGGQSSRVLPLNIEEEEDDGPQWTCSVCTFRNHPALGKCEQCEMPRISLGTDSRPPPSTTGCFCHPKLTLPAASSAPTPLTPTLVRRQASPLPLMSSPGTPNCVTRNPLTPILMRHQGQVTPTTPLSSPGTPNPGMLTPTLMRHQGRISPLPPLYSPGTPNFVASNPLTPAQMEHQDLMIPLTPMSSPGMLIRTPNSLTPSGVNLQTSPVTPLPSNITATSSPSPL